MASRWSAGGRCWTGRRACDAIRAGAGGCRPRTRAGTALRRVVRAVAASDALRPEAAAADSQNEPAVTAADAPPPVTEADAAAPSAPPVEPTAPVLPATAGAPHVPDPPLAASVPTPRRTRVVGKAAVPAVAVATVPNPRVPVEPRTDEHTWLDEEAGPVVRPYTLTGGRSRPFTSGLNMLTYVEALYAPDADLVNLQPEHRAILEMTRTATTVAELAARLDLPVGVVRVLVGDLIQANLVSTFEADAVVRAPGDDILQAVIDGLRAL